MTDPVWGDLAGLMAGARAPDMTVAEGRALRASELLRQAHEVLADTGQQAGGRARRLERQELRLRIGKFLRSERPA
jgi:hypothetical protein